MQRERERESKREKEKSMVNTRDEKVQHIMSAIVHNGAKIRKHLVQKRKTNCETCKQEVKLKGKFTPRGKHGAQLLETK